jgi:hypothetical protein
MDKHRRPTLLPVQSLPARAIAPLPPRNKSSKPAQSA